MKAGDLIRSKFNHTRMQPGIAGRTVTGIILGDSPALVREWGGRKSQWWRVLCDDGRIVEELESNIERVP